MKLKNVILSGVLAASCVMTLTGCDKKLGGNIGEEITLADGDKYVEIVIEDYGTITAKLFPDLAPKAVENFELLAESGYYDGLKIHYVAKDMCVRGGSLNGDGTGGSALVDDSGVFPIETHQDARNFYGALGYVADRNGDNSTSFYIVNNKTKTDISKYSPGLIRDEATSIAEAKESLDEYDPTIDYLTYEETYRNNLADMIEKASDEVKAKYGTTGGNPLWDGGYTVFGQVYSGFEVLDKISGVDVITGREGDATKPKVDIIIESVKVYEYKGSESEES